MHWHAHWHGMLARLQLLFLVAPSPALPSIIGTNDLRPVSSLPEQSRIRRASSGVGKLDVSSDEGNYTCTAALISPTYALTVAHCLPPNTRSVALVLGYTGPQAAGRRIPIRTAPVEVNADLNYAVLSVDGNPIVDFDAVTLLMRDPEPGESLYVLQHPAGGPLAYSTDCAVLPNSRAASGLHRLHSVLAHTCDTQGGSSGALVFSLRDNAVLGVQALGFAPGDSDPHNEALPLREIASVSHLVGDLAWVRPTPTLPSYTPPPPEGRARADDSIFFQLDEGLAALLGSTRILGLNGNEVKVAATATDGVSFRGDSPSPGLNVLKTSKDHVLTWLEERRLSVFAPPYSKSYAVLVAIDDYRRLKDERKRGNTGFGQLGQMIPNAEALRETLLTLGFPAANILPLYDNQADSAVIERVLKSFWPGGQRGDADRLFLYFGGHGSSYNGAGFLVTYDYDRAQPTLTSLLMKDLTGRQSDNIAARHVIVALDACGSGLAIQSLGDPERDKRERTRLRALSIIRNDTNARARNVLVAGTADQPAIYDSGGIFTKALIAGLRGSADLNGDRIIQFGELGVFVRDEVAYAAGQKNVEQSAGYYKLTGNGATGEVLFIRREGE